MSPRIFAFPSGVRCGLAACATVAMLATGQAFAGQVTWTGGANSDWSNAGNWNPAVPVAGDDVVLTGAGGSRPTNQDIAGLSVNSITFDGTATAAFTVGGNAITLTSAGTSVSVDAASANHTIGLDLQLAKSQSCSVGAGRILTLSGNVNLAVDATLTVTGAGDTVIAGAIADPYSYAAGLLEGNIAGNAFDETTPNPGGAVQLGIRMGQDSNKPPWNDWETWVYTGQVFVTSSSVISFAENIDDNAKVVIDGFQRLRDQGWNNPTTTGVVSLTPGWHDIEIRLGNGNGGAGPVGGNGWTASYGFGWNPNGSASNQGTAYAAPQDNGFMSLFRVSAGLLTPPANSLVKTGTGTLTLTGANTYVGNTTVSGGTLRLKGDTGSIANSTAVVINANSTFDIDNSAVPGGNPNRLSDMATLMFNGGTLSVTAPPGVNRTEAVGALFFNSGYSTINLTPDGLGNAQLTSAGFARAGSAAFNFLRNSSGVTANLFNTSMAGGAFVPYATVNGQPAV